MALDRAYVERHLREIEQHVALLRTLAQRDVEDFRGDAIAFHAAQHLLQVSIEAMISIGHHIVAALALPTPESHAELLVSLHRAGVVTDAAMLPHYQAMARFRNLVVHRYWEVDPGRVHEILRGHLDNYGRFAREILAFLDRSVPSTARSSEDPPEGSGEETAE